MSSSDSRIDTADLGRAPDDAQPGSDGTRLDDGTPPPPPPPPPQPQQGGGDGDGGGMDNAQAQAFNPETGEINWDCPCLGGMAQGPCGEEFKAAFSCFVYSEGEPKGIDCIESFKAMQDCFRAHPEVYADEIGDDDDDDDDETDLEAGADPKAGAGAGSGSTL
ncbi:Oxidoreductase [Coemansia javaensis]|uniref:Mitochondrial intermembrane space import and assembly protein 40 n=1 Tax=Coemansia javaensis TaxID=2761396 RepID=A0A9W8HEA4_9FUNG|nr:Oxidoreductase [Coemansia javaensis]